MILSVMVPLKTAVFNALLLLLSAAIIVTSVANNLHMNDGVRIQDIIAGDVFFEIIDPPALEYTYRIRPAKDFGGSFGPSFVVKEGKLVPAIPSDACEPGFENENELKGNIALIERGDCSFLTKAINVENAGARAVIITEMDSYMEDYDYYIEMIHDKTDRDTSIPAAFMLGKNGLVIRKTLLKMKRTYALINLPVNLTFMSPNQINQPPWLQW
ncbi:PRADC1-like protein [Toxorhynchites rutilus septentrionalis]|uniref:PRADC1-like protein n=1 Tax=Toxorhynchites rutilus septentrionalis TaxID=329112 RepID=UPI002478F59A|nr:PRADC1-like protein [Toxorhynchites rutilus septentrionalis]